MPLRGKRHFHHVIAYIIGDERTQRGNPRYYWFTLGCGHKKYEYHCARTVILTFELKLAFDAILKEAKEAKNKRQEYKIDYSRLPSMHCHQCARGIPHEKDAVE